MSNNSNIKSSAKGFIAGVVVTLLLASGAVALAAGTTQITATQDQDVKIIFHGEEQTLKDANSKRVYPISYEGTIYVPLRSISQLYDEPVSWDGATRSATIGTVEPIIETSGTSFLEVNYSNFTITSSSGKSATVVGGNKTGGELDIGMAGLFDGVGVAFTFDGGVFDTPPRTSLQVPNLSPGETYTIVPSDNEETEYETTLMCNDGINGLYGYVIAEGAGSYTFGVDSGISAAFAEPTAAAISLTYDESETITLYTTTVFATGRTLSLAPASDGKKMVISDAKAANIVMSGDYNSVLFEAVNATEPVFVKENESVVTLCAEDGSVIAEKPVGYTVVFLSLGGTPIDALRNVEPGTIVSAPRDPTRGGYTFAGWYKDEGYAEKWSPGNPVNENLKLLAKWTVEK
jgi:uncharacterized repeat protein (TIGR02543 family)